MEFVPYAFCEAVVAVFAEPSGPLSGLASPFWRRAIRREARCNFSCTIGYTTLGAWALEIYNHKTQTNASLEELCDANRRSHRIVYIGIQHVLNPTTELDSFEELKRSVTRIIPFVNMAHFVLDRTSGGGPSIPVEPILEIVSLFESSSFCVLGIIDEPALARFEDFAMKQMKTKWLRKFSVHNALMRQEAKIPISCAFQSAIEKFILKDAFRSVFVNWDAVTFTKEFVVQLIDTHVDGRFHLFFNFQELKEFRKSSQVPTDGHSNRIKWNREDGVQVIVQGWNHGSMYSSSIFFYNKKAFSA